MASPRTAATGPHAGALEADPADLRSLRRLDAAWRRAGRRVEGRSVRGWIARFAAEPYRPPSWPVDGWGGQRFLPTRYAPGDLPLPVPVRAVVSAGLAAVPALVDAVCAAAGGDGGRAAQRTCAHAVSALARIRPVPTCAVPAVLSSLRLDSARLRVHTLYLLADALRPDATPLAARTLAGLLRDRHADQVRITAAQALSLLDGVPPAPARHAALAALDDPQRWVRRFALATLARLPVPDDEVAGALREQVVLDDDNRPEAIAALGRFDPLAATEALGHELRATPRTGEEGDRYGRLLRVAEEYAAPLDIDGRTAMQRAALDAARRRELAAAAARRPAPRGRARTGAATVPGRRAALLSAGLPAAALATEPARALRRWVRRLREDDREWRARLALAAARRVAHLYDGETWAWQPDGADTAVRHALEAVQGWICDPDRPVPAPAGPAIWVSQYCSAQRADAAEAARSALRCADEDATWHDAAAAVDGAHRALSGTGGPVFGPSLADPRYQALAAVQLRRAIVDELLPWVHGTWDPVRDVSPPRA